MLLKSFGIFQHTFCSLVSWVNEIAQLGSHYHLFLCVVHQLLALARREDQTHQRSRPNQFFDVAFRLFQLKDWLWFGHQCHLLKLVTQILVLTNIVAASFVKSFALVFTTLPFEEYLFLIF